MAIPFGDTLRLWRVHCGLTQEALAHRAGIPRPNLSAIEHVRREVSLSTLRALAEALEVQPGCLVDGVIPQRKWASVVFTRPRLERIANAVVSGSPARDEERSLVELLRSIVRHRVSIAYSRRVPRRGRRATIKAWLVLQAQLPPAVLHSLLERIEDRLRLA